MRVLIIGAGAAGTFAAINIAEKAPASKVSILEKTVQRLSKVKVSGGGRCNVTCSTTVPKELVQNYPRGARELLGPFTKFGPVEMIQWFEARGVKLKTESDGRMFPITNSSSTIIDCFENEVKRHGVKYLMGERLSELPLNEYDAVILATGSSPAGHRLAESVGHTITTKAPSLFSLNIKDEELHKLSGTSVKQAKVSLPKLKLEQSGPLLVTHWGLSGPAALKLSAWGALKLQEASYKAQLLVDWAPGVEIEDNAKAQIISSRPEKISKRLWEYILNKAKVNPSKVWAHMSKKERARLEDALHRDSYQIDGRTTNKEEFVTCGGVDLKQVDMRTMRSKLIPNLYFAGEVLNIDAVTGGFNFQAAWTTAWIAAQAVTSALDQAMMPQTHIPK